MKKRYLYRWVPMPILDLHRGINSRGAMAERLADGQFPAHFAEWRETIAVAFWQPGFVARECHRGTI